MAKMLELVEKAFDTVCAEVTASCRMRILREQRDGMTAAAPASGDELAQGVVVVGFLSAMKAAVLWPARRVAAVVLSCASLPVRMKLNGRP
jgi:hypothetical protein